MLLAFDTSTAACTAALFDGSGKCVAQRDEILGRGHAERLVPMIAELLGDMRPDSILVGVGPGSFTGIRVAIAAAHGLAIGWNARVTGMSSLALLAAAGGTDGKIAAAMLGGHGELFVQQFDGRSLVAEGELLNAAPSVAAQAIDADIVIGPGAAQLVEARGWGKAREALPSAAAAMRLPQALRAWPARPLYARAPDARAKVAA